MMMMMTTMIKNSSPPAAPPAKAVVWLFDSVASTMMECGSSLFCIWPQFFFFNDSHLIISLAVRVLLKHTN